MVQRPGFPAGDQPTTVFADKTQVLHTGDIRRPFRASVAPARRPLNSRFLLVFSPDISVFPSSKIFFLC
jgi:hypothetical protein